MLGAAAFFNKKIDNTDITPFYAKPSVCVTLAVLYNAKEVKKGKFDPVLRYNTVETAASLLDAAVVNLTMVTPSSNGAELLTLSEEVLGAYELLKVAQRRFYSFDKLLCSSQQRDLKAKLQKLRERLRK